MRYEYIEKVLGKKWIKDSIIKFDKLDWYICIISLGNNYLNLQLRIDLVSISKIENKLFFELIHWSVDKF
jgi:hypothetical protein